MALTRPKYSQIPDTDFKQSVRVATTADIGNVMLAQMPNSVDGISLNFYDRVLVRAQANAAQNGIYQVIAVGTGSNGIWERTKDANAGSAEGKVTPAIITLVEEGTVNSGRTFRLSTTGNIDLGTTNLSFNVSTAEPAGSVGQLQFANTGNQIGGVNISSFDFTTGNLTFASGNVITATLFQNGKRVPQITSSLTPPGNPADGDQWYQVGTDILYEWINDGATSYWVDVTGATIANINPVLGPSVGTLTVNSGDDSISANTGALQVVGGVGITGNIFVGGNILTSSGVGIGGNLSILGNTPSTSNTTGALVVPTPGGIGVGGNIWAGGQIVANSRIASTSSTSGALLVPGVGGLGVGGNIWAGGNINALGNITGGGVRQTISSSAPANPVVGDQWYQLGTDILYQYVSDGTNSYWVDVAGATVANITAYNQQSLNDIAIVSGTPSTSATSGALQVAGGVGIVGNLYLQGNLDVSTGNIIANQNVTSTNTVTGSMVVRGQGGIGVGGNINVGGNLSVLQTATFAQNVQISANLTSTGTYFTAAGLTASQGNITGSGTYFGINGFTVSNGNVTATGSTATIGGLTITDGGFGSLASIAVIGNATIGGTASITGDLNVSGNVSGGGLRKYAQTSAPVNPVVGDVWYKTDTDVYYTYVNDGTNKYWIDYVGPTVSNASVQAQQQLTDLQVVSGTQSTSPTTGALTISGGAGITGNVYIAGNADIGSNVLVNNLTANLNVQASTLAILNNTTVGGTLAVAGNLSVVGAVSTGNLTTGNITGYGFTTNNGNITATGQYFSAGGLSVAAGNISAYGFTVSNGNISSTGTQAIIGGLTIENGGISSLASLNVIGSGTLGGDLAVTGNVTGGGLRKTASVSAPVNPVVGDVWYKTDTDVYYTYVNDGTSKYWIDYVGATVSNAAVSNSINSDFRVASGTESYNSDTGALTVVGGVGLTGNLWAGGLFNANGNIVANSGASSTNTTTGALVVRGGAGISGNINVAGAADIGTSLAVGTSLLVGTTANVTGNFNTLGNISVQGRADITGNLDVVGRVTGGGIRKTTSVGAPANPVVGDIWYKTDTDTVYQYIHDGTSNYWIDISGATIANVNPQTSQTLNDLAIVSGTASTNTTSGALQVLGGVGITGNVNAGNIAAGTISAGLFTFANGVSILAGNEGTYSNANVTALLATSNISIGGNLSVAGAFFSAAGVTATNGNIESTGARAVVGGLTIENGSFGNISSLGVLGNAAIGGDVVITGNITGGGIRKTSSVSAPANPVVGDQWYKTDTDTLYQYINDGTNKYWIDVAGATVSNASITSEQIAYDIVVTTDTQSTSATTGAIRVQGGIGVIGNIFTTGIANFGGNLVAGNILANNNLQASTLQILNDANITGNATVAGNIIGTGNYFSAAGLSATAGNIAAFGFTVTNGNLTANGATATIGGLTITNGSFGNVASLTVLGAANIGGDVVITGNVTGGGIRKTSSIGAPANPVVGDQWYKTDTDTLYQYINDGTNKYWVDVAGATVSNANATSEQIAYDIVVTTDTQSTSATTGAIRVQGGIGLIGNIFTTGLANFGSNLTAQNILSNNNLQTNTLQVLNDIDGNGNLDIAGAASITGNLTVAGNYFSAGGLSVTAGNITAFGFSTSGGNIVSNGASATIGGLTITNGSFGNVASLSVLGTANIGSDLTVTGNITGGGIRKTASVSAPANPVVGDVWYKTDTDVLYQYVNDGTNTYWIDYTSATVSNANPTSPQSLQDLQIVSGTPSTDTVTGALVVTGGAGISGNINAGNISATNISASIFTYANGVSILSGNEGTYSNANVAGYLTSATIATSGNISSSGSYFAGGGISITAGNILATSANIGGLIISGGGIGQLASIGVSGSGTVGGDFAVTGNITGGGLRKYAQTSAPVNPVVGDVWYKTDTDVYYTYINDGTSSYWIDYASAAVSNSAATAGTNVDFQITSGTPSTDTSTGALTVVGGVGVSGNINSNNINTTTLVATNIQGQNFYFANGTSVAAAITGTYSNANVIGLLAGAISTGNIVSSGDITATGNITGGGIRKTTSLTAPVNPVVGDLWYKTDTDVLYQYINDGSNTYWVDYVGATVSNAAVDNSTNVDFTITSGTPSSDTETGALRVAGGFGITGNIFAGGIVSATGNIVANATTASTNTSTGALVVRGGAGIAGATYIGGLLSVAQTLTVTGNVSGANIATGQGNFSGNITAANIFTAGRIDIGGDIVATGNITAGGVRKYAQTSAPAGAVPGDVWYKTDTDVYYTYVNDGTNNYWVDYVSASVSNAAISNGTNADFTITSGTASTSTATGAFTVVGGAGITGNVHAGNVITNNISASVFTYANGVSILAGNEGTYSNANVAAYLTTASLSTTGNISSTGSYFAGGGLTALAGAVSGSSLSLSGNINSSGTRAVLGGLTIENGGFGNLASLGVIGSVTIGGDVAVTGNITGGGLRKYAQTSAPVNPVVGDVWYKTDSDVYYQYINDGTANFWVDFVSASVANVTQSAETVSDLEIVSGTPSTSSSTGALVVAGGVGVSGSINVAANVSAGNVIANSVLAATFTYANGANILDGYYFGTYSNANVSGYLSAQGIATTNGNLTASGIYFAAAGLSSLNGNITAAGARAEIGGLVIENGGIGSLANLSVIANATIGGDLIVTGNITGGGIRKTTSSTAPVNPVVGDIWYKQDTDVYYEYINDGSNKYWVDMISPTVANITQSAETVSDLEIVSGTPSSDVNSGALRVSGGVGITGNLNAGNVAATNVSGTVFTYANGANILDGYYFGTYSNANVVAWLAANGITATSNGITTTGNLSASGSYLAAGGITALSGAMSGASLTLSGNINSAGSLAVLGGLTIQNGGFGNLASIGVIGNATIGGDVAVTGNITGGGIRKTSSTTAPPNPVVGDLWYKTDSDVLYQYTNDGTNTFWIDFVSASVSNAAVDNSTNNDFAIASGTAAVSYNTGALQVVGGAGISGNIFAGNNITANENISGATGIFTGNLTTGNLSTGIVSATGAISALSISAGGLTAIANSLSIPGIFAVTATGNLTASGQYFSAGGLSVTAGNIVTNNFSVTNGNIIATGSTANIGGLVITNGGFGSIASLNVIGHAAVGGNLTVTGNITGGGMRKYAQLGAPANPVVGDIWYKTDTDIVYEYINDGTNTYWVDLTSASVANVTASYDNLGDLNVVGNITVTSGYFRFANGTPYITTTLANTNNIVANISNGFNVGLDLTTTGVTAGNYGSATSIPTIVVDDRGRISSITSNAVSTTFGLQGNVGSSTVTGGNTIVVVGVPNQIQTTVTGNTISIGFTPNISFTDFTVSGNLVYGTNGLRSTTSATPPNNPTNGDFWYQSGTDILYRYINDGTSEYWLDLFSTPLRAILPSNDIAGGDGQVQYYDNAAFGANSTFVFDKTTGTLRVPKFRITQSQSPATPNSPGQQGEISWDGSWLYVCVAPNSWLRAGLYAW